MRRDAAARAWLALSLLALAPGAALAGEEYKQGEAWPLRNFRGLDFAEPLLPLAAFSSGDVGRIALGTALPYAMLVTSFAATGTDRTTLDEIARWRWAGADDGSDNYPLLFGLCGLSALSILLPAPADADGYSGSLRFDRLTVLGLGLGISSLEYELLRGVFARTRPDGEDRDSRPSGHVVTAFAAAAFLSDVLRDTLAPATEERLALRIVEEIATAVPYAGAAYIALERVHVRRHYLTDALLGGALGALTMHMFYAWSFTREEQGRPWIALSSVGYDPVLHATEVSFSIRF